jgi:AMP-binding enzyme
MIRGKTQSQKKGLPLQKKELKSLQKSSKELQPRAGESKKKETPSVLAPHWTMALARRIAPRAAGAARRTVQIQVTAVPRRAFAAAAPPAAKAAASKKKAAKKAAPKAAPKAKAAAAPAEAALPPVAMATGPVDAPSVGWRPAPSAGTLGAQIASTRDHDEFKDAVAIGCNNHRWTYKDLERQIDALGNGFISSRLQPGHTVITTLDLDAESVVTLLAAAECGLRVVALPGATAAELASALEATQAEAVILDPKVIKPEDLAGEIPELDHYPFGKAFVCSRFPALRNILQTDYRPKPGMLTFRDVLAYDLHPHHNYMRRWAVPMVTPDHAALGSADGKVSVSQADLLKHATRVAKQLELTRADRVCLGGSAVAEWAVQNAMWPSIVSGSMFIVPGKENDNVTKAEPRDIVAALDNESCTVLVTSPGQLEAMLATPQAVEKFDLSQLRTVAVVGGDAKQHEAAAKKIFGVENFVQL